MRPALTLLLLALLAFWPQIDVPEWRDTEARRVQIALEMQRSGDWLVPTLGGQPTYAKPPLHYWVLAALLYLGDDAVLLRLPSVLGFWALAVAAFAALRARFGALSAYFGSAGILLSPMVLYHVPSAEIDPLFAVLTGLSILWLAEGACFGQRSRLVAGGVFGGLALLCKGPPYFLFLAGTALVWARRLRLRGAPWFAVPLLVVPSLYYGPLLLAADGEELARVAGEESIRRLAFLSWASVAGLPIYFLGVVAMLMPLGWWTFHEFRGDREMRETTVGAEEAFLRMCAAAMVSAALLLALFPGRSARYLLPGVPLFMVGVAAAVASYARYGLGPSLVLGKVVRLGAVLAAAGLIATPWLLPVLGPGLPILLLAVAVAAFWVRTRRQVAVYALAMPLLSAWTVFPGHAAYDVAPPRSYRLAGQILERELRRLGADGGDLATYGHVASQLVLQLARNGAPVLPGDERGSQPPTARWLLREEVRGRPEPPLAGYRDRVRIQLYKKDLVIQERTDLRAR
jgi:4-amino-4-deoxy-L-arabinose transferase-like glycosyltransferase